MASTVEVSTREQVLANLVALPHWEALSNAGRRRLILAEFRRLGLLGTMRGVPVTLGGGRFGPTSAVVPGQPVNVRVNDPGEDAAAGNDTTQSEPSLAVSPPYVVASFNDSAPAAGWAGYSNSSDGGISFHDDGGLAPEGSERSDQVLAVDAAGNFYMSALGVDSLSRDNVGVATSIDHGATFGAPVDASTTANASGSADKQWLAADATGGPHDGNLYLAWTNFEATPRIVFARSIDGNASWLAPLHLSAVGTNPHGAMPVVAPDGTVFVVWFDRSSGDISLRKSTDGGGSFVNPLTGGGVVATISLMPTTLNGGFRANSFPSIAVGPDGRIYIAYAARNGTDNADVFVTTSNTGGASWSTSVRVNDDATSTDQWMPSVAVATNGVVGVMFYDRRNDAANLNIDVYLALSVDHGATFLANRRITDQSFPPVIGFDPRVNSVYMGDYNQMVAVGTRLYMVWGDNRDIVGARRDPDVFYAQFGTEDCYVRDSPADDGTVPSAAGQAYQSPDIIPAMNPSVFGKPNAITVTVHNFGPKDAKNVDVQLFWADPATYIPRSAWHSDRFTVAGTPGNDQTLALIPAGGSATSDPFVWNPPDPTLATENGHFCLLAQIQSAGDPLTFPGAGGWQTIERDNNLAVRNVHVQPLGSGAAKIRFLLGADDHYDVEATVTLDLRRVPGHLEHTLVLGAEVAREARFVHLSHHPAELERMPLTERRKFEQQTELPTHSDDDDALAVHLPHNRVVQITGLQLPATQSSLAELRIHRRNSTHAAQDGELHVTQEIGGRVVGGLLYLLRAERPTDAAIEADR